jgi:hypothetical protein
MATQYSNKPIVTDGLVYALDFGNQKSYVSGSSSARSLLFNPTTASIVSAGGLSLPNIVNGLLQFNLGSSTTTGSYINIPQDQNNIQWQNGSYTFQFTAQQKGGNLFISHPTINNSKLISSVSNYGYYLTTTGNYVSRGFSNPSSSILTHYTFRYSSGSYSFFVNGVPVSASTLDTYNEATNNGTGISISGNYIHNQPHH